MADAAARRRIRWRRVRIRRIRQRWRRIRYQVGLLALVPLSKRRPQAARRHEEPATEEGIVASVSSLAAALSNLTLRQRARTQLLRRWRSAVGSHAARLCTDLAASMGGVTVSTPSALVMSPARRGRRPYPSPPPSLAGTLDLPSEEPVAINWWSLVRL